MLLFPVLIFFEALPAHVLTHSNCPTCLFALGIRGSYTVLDDLCSTDDCRIGAGMKLHRGNGNKREGHVATVGPRESFRLGDLHSQIHCSLGALLPPEA